MTESEDGEDWCNSVTRERKYYRCPRSFVDKVDLKVTE